MRIDIWGTIIFRINTWGTWDSCDTIISERLQVQANLGRSEKWSADWSQDVAVECVYVCRSAYPWSWSSHSYCRGLQEHINLCLCNLDGVYSLHVICNIELWVLNEMPFESKQSALESRTKKGSWLAKVAIHFRPDFSDHTQGLPSTSGQKFKNWSASARILKHSTPLYIQFQHARIVLKTPDLVNRTIRMSNRKSTYIPDPVLQLHGTSMHEKTQRVKDMKAASQRRYYQRWV